MSLEALVTSNCKIDHIRLNDYLISFYYVIVISLPKCIVLTPSPPKIKREVTLPIVENYYNNNKNLANIYFVVLIEILIYLSTYLACWFVRGLRKFSG